MTSSGTGSGRWTAAGGIVEGRDGLLSFIVIFGTETDSLFWDLDFNKERKALRGLCFIKLFGVVKVSSTKSSVFMMLSSVTCSSIGEGVGEKGNLCLVLSNGVCISGFLVMTSSRSVMASVTI